MNRPITLCDRCKEYARCCLNYDGDNCRRNRTVEPTNVDRIRSMTDEELADFYSNNLNACPPGHDSSKCIDELYAHGEGPYPSNKQCMECWLDWMKQDIIKNKKERIK